jgi:hypothetical protein
MGKTVITEEYKISGDGHYWPLCLVSDQGLFYIYLSVCAGCATLIILMIILTFWLVPVLVG